jgi:hypothetical protein
MLKLESKNMIWAKNNSVSKIFVLSRVRKLKLGHLNVPQTQKFEILRIPLIQALAKRGSTLSFEKI